MSQLITYILRRIGSMIPTVFAVITISFLVTRFVPGDPFGSEGLNTESAIASLYAKHGLDKPIYEQYFWYLINLIRGDFGLSLHYTDRNVGQILAESFPVSLALGLSSLCISVGLGTLLGVLSAVKKDTCLDYLFSSIAIMGISLPLFVFAPLLVFVFSIKLRLLPTSGWIFEGWNRTILPIIALSLPNLAMIARLMRTSTIGVLKSDYIRTAKAKGLPVPSIVIKHALRGALLPVISYLGPMMAGLMTGSLVIEQIFRIPGMARPFIQSTMNRDYPLIMGCVITYALLLIVVNIIVDVFYTILDPRISYNLT